MNPLLLIAAAVAGAYVLMSGKKPASTQSGTIIKVPTQPTSIQTPAGTVTVKPSVPVSTESGTTITVPEVKITPADLPLDLPTPTNVIAATNASPNLTYEEQVSVESSLPDDLYRMAMASNHPAYVVAAAARLALLGDTRAADLTLRIANWGH
jgi:hypothetical protein